MNLDGAFDAVDALGLIPARLHARVNKVGLVAARDDHRAAVARTDIGERQEHINLSAAETAVDEAVLPAYDAVLAAGVEREIAARPTNRSEALVDEQPFHVRVF